MFLRSAFRTLSLAGLAAALLSAGEDTNSNDRMELGVASGAVSFVANTNVPAVTVKGKSTALMAQVTARRDPQGLHIEHIEAAVAVKTLQTGMGLRDDHMRKHIFTTKDGQTPDVIFRADNVDCPVGTQITCNVNGSLSIRGVAHDFAVPLKVRDEGGAFKASGESVVKLSDYGIEPPSQLGVKTDNNVQLRLDFTVRPGHVEVTRAGSAK